LTSVAVTTPLRVRDKYTAAGVAARTKVQLNQVARSEGLLP